MAPAVYAARGAYTHERGPLESAPPGAVVHAGAARHRRSAFLAGGSGGSGGDGGQAKASPRPGGAWYVSSSPGKDPLRTSAAKAAIASVAMRPTSAYWRTNLG